MYWRSQKSSFFSEEQNYKPPFHLPTGLVVIFDLRKLQGVLCTRYLLEGKKGAKNLIISYTYLPSTYYAISDCHFFCKVENRGEWRCNYLYWQWNELKYLTVSRYGTTGGPHLVRNIAQKNFRTKWIRTKWGSYVVNSTTWGFRTKWIFGLWNRTITITITEDSALFKFL